ncbi:MAG: HAD family phosphatase [Candidatus Microgenomates bacterium]|jgi:HAD superfamily hydrolase (TIGR01509 family)
MILSAVIFDLDGTLINSSGLWSKAFSEVLKSLGKEPISEHPEIPGVGIEDNWRILLVKYNITTDKTLDELKSLTYKHYVKFLQDIKLIEGARNFLENLRESNIEIALATNCEWWVVEEVFKKLDLDGVFDATVTGEEILNKKPFPDAFLLAADKLDVPAKDCLVIGDTQSDIDAAKSAGMKVIIISDLEDEKNLTGADLIVGKFSEITPKLIAQL